MTTASVSRQFFDRKGRSLSHRVFIPELAVAAALLSLLAACAAPAPELRAAVEVKLLAFNDFHGYLTPPFSGMPQPAPDPAGVRTLIPAGGIEHLASVSANLLPISIHALTRAELLVSAPLHYA